MSKRLTARTSPARDSPLSRRGGRTAVGVIVAALTALVFPTVTAPPSHAAAPTLTDDVYVRSTSPSTNFGTASNLVVGKGGHAYFRFDISQIDVSTLQSVVLNMTKYNNAANLVAVRSSEYLTSAGKPTGTTWTESNITWNNRPLDVQGSPVASATAPQGNAAVPIDITELVKAAKTAKSDVLSIDLTTTAVDDQTVAGTDIYSTRATNAAVRPSVQVARVTDVPAVDYPVSQSFSDYPSNGQSAQDVVRIADESGKYLTVDKSSGAVGLTDTPSSAGLFAVYGYKYTAAPYQGLGGGQQTTYSIKSLDSGKYLTIQNYAGGAGRPYYTKSGANYDVTAGADDVGWNERFSVKGYPSSHQYTIASHLDALRDGAEATVSPVQASATGLVVAPGDKGAHLFTFTSAKSDLLEVQQSVTGSSVRLAWKPVNGDTDASHYTVDGNATAAFDGTVLAATITGVTTGVHEYAVQYNSGSGPVLSKVDVEIFNHPGVSLTGTQLDAMRDHIAKKQEPWYSDYLRLKNSVPNSMSSLDFQPVFRSGVGRGAPQGSGNIADYENSGGAAYFLALQWVITGDDRYAAKTAQILDGWSSTLKQIDGRDQILGAGLATLKYINAAEILRYYHGGYSGYSGDQFAAFQRLMLNVVYPDIQDAGAPMIANGNWDGAAIVSLEAIGVLTDSKPIFDRAVSMYKSPFINGSIENYVTDWGQTQETARDQAHAQLGLGLMGDIARIAESQSVDLWSLNDNKLARAFNWVAQYNLFSGQGELRAEPVPNIFGRTDNTAYWTTLDQQSILRGQLRPIYENALAHYSQVPGVDVTWLARAAQASRPEGLVHMDELNFDTLAMYNGPATTTVAPYIQLRTMLTPWYQRTWPEVSAWGDAPLAARTMTPGGTIPADYATETLNSYLAIQNDSTVAVSAMQKKAPYFRLVTNSDESYSLQDATTGRYLSVTATVVNGENEIVLGPSTVGDAEKFEVRSTGVGRYYLVHDGRLVDLAVDGPTSSPNDAKVSLRLSTQAATTSPASTATNSLFFSFGTPLTVEAKASVVKSAGNSNDLTITVTTAMSDGSTTVSTETVSINNNSAGTYAVGTHQVYVDTQGNTQVRECRVVS
ncbi:CBM96 family carbohydrate-binding protein [Arthrobacter sp. SLBN-122]|uniref:CBM96 family carbohydrate-binding protein n=1 Tax=Arthrobacter sp. SLBN-122 TaxID=2768455 RepID=UPI001175209D|nr:DNRLRE domain-containing protein [Arthrobacter sp. SLBN-122]TQJ34683.1 alginate lyase [Arthrobacter sp. SLBN-122]